MYSTYDEFKQQQSAHLSLLLEQWKQACIQYLNSPEYQTDKLRRN